MQHQERSAFETAYQRTASPAYGALLCFIGLWQNEQFTILTAPSSGCVADLHDRMPIILNDNDWDWWVLKSNDSSGKESFSRAASPEQLPCIQRISVEEKQSDLSL